MRGLMLRHRGRASRHPGQEVRVSKRRHRFALLLLYSLGGSSFILNQSGPPRKPDHLTKRILLNFPALTHDSLCYTHGCAQRGCSCLRDSSGNIWTRSTVVFLPLRIALMRKFLAPTNAEAGSLCQEALPVSKKKKKKSMLKLFLQAGAHF